MLRQFSLQSFSKIFSPIVILCERTKGKINVRALRQKLEDLLAILSFNHRFIGINPNPTNQWGENLHSTCLTNLQATITLCFEEKLYTSRNRKERQRKMISRLDLIWIFITQISKNTILLIPII